MTPPDMDCKCDGEFGYIEVYFTSKAVTTFPTAQATGSTIISNAERYAAVVSIAKITSLVERSTKAFPVLAGNFDWNWDAWQKTWDSPELEDAASSNAFAKGPEWDALVSMGPAILPPVVAKLQSNTNIFGCQLYKSPLIFSYVTILGRAFPPCT
jgi:hypothetical protein